MDPVPTANKFTLLAGEDIDVSLTETTLPVIAVNETVSLVKNSPIGKSIDSDTQTTSDEPAVTSVNVNPESLSAGNREANVNPVTAPSSSITFKITHQVNWPPPVLNCCDSDYFRTESTVPGCFLCWVVHFSTMSTMELSKKVVERHK